MGTKTTSSLPFLLAAAVCASCGTSPPSDAGAETEGSDTVVLPAGTRMASIDSVEDIAEWASYVLRVEVTGEGERNTSPLGPGEELVGRDVSVLVYEVTWAHPGAVNPVSAGETLTVYTFPGYIRSEGELRPAVEDGDTRMEVGTDYVVVMADDLDVNGEQILTLLDSFTDEDDQAVLADGTELESGPLATDPTLRDVAADAGPRRGESLVDRLERYTDEADTSRP